MRLKHCKENCDFLHDSLGKKPKCLIYKKKLKYDDEGYLRLKKCVRDSRDWKIKMQIEDIKTYYDTFICEMDYMFDRLNKLLKGEK